MSWWVAGTILQTYVQSLSCNYNSAELTHIPTMHFLTVDQSAVKTYICVIASLLSQSCSTTSTASAPQLSNGWSSPHLAPSPRHASAWASLRRLTACSTSLEAGTTTVRKEGRRTQRGWDQRERLVCRIYLSSIVENQLPC